MSTAANTLEGRTFEPGQWLSRLAALTVFFGAVEMLAIALSLTGIGISRLSAAAVLLAALAAAAAYHRILRPGGDPPPARSTVGWPLIVFCLVAATIYGLLWLLAYAFADLSFDGLWYHIPAMHFWALKGGVHWITADPSAFWGPLVDNCINGFPKGVELVTFVLVRATGLNRLLNSVNLPFLPLGMLAVACLSRFLGATARFSLLAGLLFLFIPVNIAQATTSYVDAATACCYAALFALLAFSIEELAGGRIPWKMLPALGAGLGLSMGAKTPGLLLLPASLFWLAVGVLAGRRWTGVRPPGCGSAKLYILLVLLTAVAVGGYWPLRNFLRTANPFNPAGIAIAGRTLFPDLAWENQFHAPHLPGTEEWSQGARIFCSWLGGPAGWRWTPVASSPQWGALGFLWLLGCLPALGWLAVRVPIKFIRRPGARRPLRREAILVALIPLAVLLFFAMPPRHNHLSRYTIWLYGLGLPAFTLAGEKLWYHRRSFCRRSARILISAVIFFFLIEAAVALRFRLEITRLRRDQSGSRPELLNSLIRSVREPYPAGYPEGSLMAVLLAGDCPVALGPLPGFHRLLLGRLGEGEAFGRRRIYFLEPEMAEDPAELERFLRERSVRFVIWDAESGLPAPLAELALLRDYAAEGLYILAYNFDLRPAAGEGL